MLFDDTIAAISTAPGSGAIAIVRMSGPRAWSIAREIFSPGREHNKETFSGFKSHAAIHGYIKDPQTEETADEVVVIAYKGPHSYTGEDLIEINCHGGSIVTREILRLCLAGGARLARAGEYTQRAFLNGRLDLTQAEAVLDVIQAKTARQSRLALSALKGQLGEEIQGVRDRLLELLSRVVAGIDFPEEVGELPLNDIDAIVDTNIARLEKLAKTSLTGRFLREGLKMAIVGKPNAGKSSLLNQLLCFERAIVTDIPGTTRDSLEELLDLNGVPVILVDTAGIRHTDDKVERIGIERTHKAIDEADLVLFVVDAACKWSGEDDLILSMIQNRPHIILANKIDLKPDFKINPCPPESGCLATLRVSAKLGVGMDELTGAVERWVFRDQNMSETGASLNQRQGELCQKALSSLGLARQTIVAQMPQDCLATDLKAAIDCLSEICGEAVSEEVITNVFANFCIGK